MNSEVGGITETLSRISICQPLEFLNSWSSSLITENTGSELQALVRSKLNLIRDFKSIATKQSLIDERKDFLKRQQKRLLLLARGVDGLPFGLSLDLKGDYGIWTCERFGSYFQDPEGRVHLYTFTKIENESGDHSVMKFDCLKMWVQEGKRIVVKSGVHQDVYDVQTPRWILDFAMPMEVFEYLA